MRALRCIRVHAKAQGHMISFSGRIFNQRQAPAISRKQSSLPRNTRAWEWVCALFCVISMAGCAGLVSQNLPAPSGQLSATPGSVDFGTVEVGISSTQSITFNNTGSGSLTISQAAVSGAGFTLVGQTFPLTLSAGQSSSVNVQFAPTDTSSTTGSVSLLSSATTLATNVTLKGAGVKHQLSITPSSVGFGNVAVGTANAQTVTLTNSGTANLNISQGGVTGAGFGMSGLTFPFSLAPGQSSTFNAQFAPTAAGSASGSVSISSNAYKTPTVASLTGSGTLAALSPNPSTFNFGNVLVGSSGTQTITLSNSGTASIAISAASASGTGFSIAGLSVPATLTPGQTTSFTTSFAPASASGFTGGVSITSNAPGSPLTIPLSGTGTAAQPQLTINPAGVSFGSVNVGATATQTVSLANSGNAALTISQATASGKGFSLTGLNLPQTINAGSSISFTSQFLPVSTGSASGNISISTNAPGSPAAVALSGTGVQGTLTANPSSFNFGNVLVGGNGTQTFTLSNSGTASVTISAASASGTGFSITGLSVPLTLAAGQNTTFSGQFAPSATGSATGSVSITSNAPGSPLAIALSGTGVAPTLLLGANPTSLNLGNVNVGGNGSSSVTLTNTGNSNVTVSSVTVSGAGFSASGVTSGTTLTLNQTVTLSVAFAPAAAGNVPGSVSVASNATNSPATITLSGTGVQGALTPNPSSFNFGNVLVGSSGTQTFTLSNSGTASIAISAASTSGTGFSITGLSVPATLNPGQTTSFTASFAPASASSFTGSVSITSNAPGSPLTIPLSGTGSAAQPQLTINPASVNFGSVNVGATATQTVSLTNSGNAALTISQATPSGTGFSFTGLTLPQTINAGSSISFTSQFLPASTGSASGNIAISSNAPGSPAAIALSGTGVQGTLTANPSSFNFGNVLVGGNGTQTFTLSNSGTASVTISAASVLGTGFSITGLSVPLTLAAGQNTTFSGQFAPSATGSATGSVSITSNAPGSPLAIALSGTGVQPQLAPTPSSASFGSVVTGTSNSQTIKLSNAGSASVTISQATVSGAGFTITGPAVPLTIAAGSSATFNVAFTPGAAGSVTGTVSLVSNAPNSPLTIALSGTGVTATFLLTASPTSLSFGSVNLGSNSSLSTSLTNTGNSNVTLSSVTASGASFSASGVTSGTTLTPNQAVTLSVIFAPGSAGSLTGSVSVASNATNSPATIALSGTGVQLIAHSAALSWTASTSVVAGYNVYRGTVSGGPYSKLNSSLIALTTHTDSTVQSGQTYFYVVTAVDASNVESAYSNTISAIIPFP